MVVARDFATLIAEVNAVIEFELRKLESEKKRGTTIALIDPISMTTIRSSIKVKPLSSFFLVHHIVCNSMPCVESWLLGATLYFLVSKI